MHSIPRRICIANYVHNKAAVPSNGFEINEKKGSGALAVNKCNYGSIFMYGKLIKKVQLETLHRNYFIFYIISDSNWVEACGREYRRSPYHVFFFSYYIRVYLPCANTPVHVAHELGNRTVHFHGWNVVCNLTSRTTSI